MLLTPTLYVLILIFIICFGILRDDALLEVEMLDGFLPASVDEFLLQRRPIIRFPRLRGDD